MERPHDEDGEGEDEGERGEEDVGEVGDGEDGGCADVQGVEDAGPGHEDGDEGEAGVEDEEGGQGVRGEEEAAPGPRHTFLVLVSEPGQFILQLSLALSWVRV